LGRARSCDFISDRFCRRPCGCCQYSDRCEHYGHRSLWSLHRSLCIHCLRHQFFDDRPPECL